MSVEKNRREAERWFKTAQGDLESAVILMKNARYPNGLPELTPDEAYLEEDAESCIETAKKIIKAVKSLIVT